MQILERLSKFGKRRAYLSMSPSTRESGKLVEHLCCLVLAERITCCPEKEFPAGEDNRTCTVVVGDTNLGFSSEPRFNMQAAVRSEGQLQALFRIRLRAVPQLQKAVVHITYVFASSLLPRLYMEQSLENPKTS
jgi:hypothetical protein